MLSHVGALVLLICVSRELTCAFSTGKPTTERQQPTHPVSRFGCYHDDHWYPPGSDISKGQSGRFCYGVYCDSSGQVIMWDNFNCHATTILPSTFPPTTPPTTVVVTTPFGCYQDGKWYAPGSDMTKGQDGNWCYGAYCGHDGEIIQWDNWNCGVTTPGMTTPEPTTAPLSCYYRGRRYKPQSYIERKWIGNRCYGRYCTARGKTVKLNVKCDRPKQDD